jgi:hypothetical protein
LVILRIGGLRLARVRSAGKAEADAAEWISWYRILRLRRKADRESSVLAWVSKASGWAHEVAHRNAASLPWRAGVQGRDGAGRRRTSPRTLGIGALYRIGNMLFKLLRLAPGCPR